MAVLIRKLQASNIGDPGRLSAIRHAMDSDRTIYESDVQYVEKLASGMGVDPAPRVEGSDTIANTRESSITVSGIESIKRARLGDPKYLDMVSKKLKKGKALSDRESEYVRGKLREYADLDEKEGSRRIEQIKKMREDGDDARLERLQKTLERGNRITDEDRAYFEAKYRESTQIIVTKTMNVEGYRITAYLGIVTGLSALGMNVISDVVTGLSDFFGGRSRTYEKYFKRAREDAMRDMIAEAEKAGANAIVGVSIDLVPIASQNKSMVMVGTQGTAVLVEKS